ncbi:MAG: GNAT family N-acetyltransferase [Desulfatiglans sp.]|jgi:ribosomal protein S18 acetylase RimI-like enzyme|nr:GNAT family N-acetyltransferase [Thermodesulfobacteriota bacterium]MEE4352280.1 GNAT family N-acetyltransferase [Desulfatiglans sp.]
MQKREEKFSIRQMTPNDIEDIMRIDRKISGLDRSLTYDINDVIGGHIDLSFIAEVDGKTVGFLLSSLAYVSDEICEASVIQTMGVDPNFRRRGIATRLVQALVDTSRSKGIRMIKIMVDKKDNDLIGLFEDLSFARGRFIDYSRIL